MNQHLTKSSKSRLSNRPWIIWTFQHNLKQAKIIVPYITSENVLRILHALSVIPCSFSYLMTKGSDNKQFLFSSKHYRKTLSHYQIWHLIYSVLYSLGKHEGILLLVLWVFFFQLIIYILIFLIVIHQEEFSIFFLTFTIDCCSNWMHFSVKLLINSFLIICSTINI